MLIKHSNKLHTKAAPDNLSDYHRTFNHAIDLVTQAVGWANKVSTRKVAAIVLKPTQYQLFFEGYKLILKKQRDFDLEDGTELTFEGYRILKGGRGQIDSLVFEYVENTLNENVIKPPHNGQN
jgi:hypothetical protein